MLVGEAEAKKGQTGKKRSPTNTVEAVAVGERTVPKSHESENAAQVGKSHVREVEVKTEVISVNMRARTMIVTVLTMKKSKESKMIHCDISMNGSH